MVRIIYFVIFFLWGGVANAESQSLGFFRFSDWSGPPIRVYYYEPEGLDSSAPIIIVMHGVNRDAANYLKNWIEPARKYGWAIYAPEFDSNQFPGSLNYNLGSVGQNPAGAFDAIEPLFDSIKKRRKTLRNEYVIFGHSAGAQFVHRFAMLRQNARFRLAIAANAGWYTMPTYEIDWPYGLGSLRQVQKVDLVTSFSKPLLIMLGEDDNDPNAKQLRDSNEANAQGQHRFARGLKFINTAKETAALMNAPLAWQHTTVRDIAHSHAKMARAAAEHIAINLHKP